MTRKRSILWAILLIGIGLVLLLRNTGVLSENVSLWPLLLVAIGVWLALERLLFGSRFGGGFVWPLILIAVGLVFFLQDAGAIQDEGVLVPAIVIAIGLGLVLTALFRGPAAGAEEASVPLEGATEARIRIEHGAGRLTLLPMVGGETLVEGRFVGGVRTDVRRSGERLEVTLEKPAFGWDERSSRDWTVSVNRRVPIHLELKTGANNATLELGDLTLRELTLDTGASTTAMHLPTTGRVGVRVHGGAATVRIHVPVRVAARVESRSGLASVGVDERRFPKVGDEWRSADFDEAENRADIGLELGAATVTVE